MFSLFSEKKRRKLIRDKDKEELKMRGKSNDEGRRYYQLPNHILTYK